MKPPHKLDVGKKRLRSLIAANPEAAPKLPLVHTTDTYSMADINEDGMLSPSPCKIYAPEHITYLFYGRPSFRPNLNEEPLSLTHYFPVCFIFKFNDAIPIRRILPFDSGAFQLNLYASYMHERMKIGDFSLEADPSTPGKVISHFFQNASAYMKGQPNSSISNDPSEFEAHSLLELYNSKQSNVIDSRSSSVEIQVDQALNLSSDLMAVVMPSSFSDSDVGIELRNAGKDVIPYQIIGRSRPTEYMGSVHQAIMTYYVEKKILLI